MSTDPKLPWFKFEPQVWLSDKEVRKLTHSQRGIYMDLLSIDWISRGIPENPSEACNLITGGAKVKDVEPVLALFKSKLSGGIVTHKRNERQRMEFAEKSEASRASAKSRWKGRGRDANASESHADRGCETDADALRTHSERTADAVPTDMRNACEIDAEGHAKGMPRALARDERLKKEDKYITPKTDSTSSVPAESPKSVSAEKGLARPDSEEAAIKLCKGQLIDAPEAFIRQLYNHLVSVGWVNGAGTGEIQNFGAYVRKAWLQSKDESARRCEGRRRPEPEVKRQVNGKVSTGIDYGDKD